MKKICFTFIAIVMLCAIGTSAEAQAFQVDPLDAAIREASTYLNGKIPKGNKTIFLNITSNYPDLSEYIISLLSENAVNDKIFSVVDRGQIDSIRAELSFQMSGDVDDDSAQSIGKMLGAQSIVSGTVIKIGSLYRLQVKAIEVQTAEVKGQWSKNFPGGSPTIAALTETQSAPAASSSGTTTASSSGTVKAPTTTGAAVTYKVGDKGPAGGIVFHDKGVFYDGWRYLEAALYDIGPAQWGYVIDAGSDSYGKTNSQRIIAKLKENEETGRAVQLCAALDINGCKDWFLPSKEELNWMYVNLHKKGLGSFQTGYYWSSSDNYDYGYPNVWAQRFSDGSQYHSRGNERETYSVRAVRSF